MLKCIMSSIVCNIVNKTVVKYQIVCPVDHCKVKSKVQISSNLFNSNQVLRSCRQRNVTKKQAFSFKLTFTAFTSVQYVCPVPWYWSQENLQTLQHHDHRPNTGTSWRQQSQLPPLPLAIALVPLHASISSYPLPKEKTPSIVVALPFQK